MKLLLSYLSLYIYIYIGYNLNLHSLENIPYIIENNNKKYSELYINILNKMYTIHFYVPNLIYYLY